MEGEVEGGDIGPVSWWTGWKGGFELEWGGSGY